MLVQQVAHLHGHPLQPGKPAPEPIEGDPLCLAHERPDILRVGLRVVQGGLDPLLLPPQVLGDPPRVHPQLPCNQHHLPDCQARALHVRLASQGGTAELDERELFFPQLLGDQQGGGLGHLPAQAPGQLQEAVRLLFPEAHAHHARHRISPGCLLFRRTIQPIRPRGQGNSAPPVTGRSMPVRPEPDQHDLPMPVLNRYLGLHGAEGHRVAAHPLLDLLHPGGAVFLPLRDAA